MELWAFKFNCGCPEAPELPDQYSILSLFIVIAPLEAEVLTKKKDFASPRMLGNRKKHSIECFFIV